METSLRAEWATLACLNKVLLYFTLLYKLKVPVIGEKMYLLIRVCYVSTDFFHIRL